MSVWLRCIRKFNIIQIIGIETRYRELTSGKVLFPLVDETSLDVQIHTILLLQGCEHSQNVRRCNTAPTGAVESGDCKPAVSLSSRVALSYISAQFF